MEAEEFAKKKVDESWKDQIWREKENEARNRTSNQNRPQEKDDGANSAFSQFVTSLAMQTLVHFGEIENPTNKVRSQNLDAAKEIIDLLVLLKEKTSGNLSANESKLLESILTSLQMKFVDFTRAQ